MVSDVYAYDQGGLVERSLVLESVLNASELEVDLQSNIRITSDCLTDRQLVEFIGPARDTHRANPVVGIPEPFDLLVRTRVVIRQDD